MRIPARLSLLVVIAVSTLACGPSLYEGMPTHVEARHVALDGAANFRDLGGYATADGQRVKWGQLYRADALGDLSDDDLEVVSKLGIKLVCDFRSPQEVAEAPDRLPETDPPELFALPILDEGTFQDELRARITSGDLEGFDWDNLLVDANRAFVTDYADRYARMFERILEPASRPALVHCTGGKDRAGFASALLLRTLGVPQETVMEDFLLTNHYTAAKIDQIVWIVRLTSFFQTDADKLRPVLGVERRYLEAAFEQIEESHGSFDAFRRDALGVDDREMATFRAALLEPADAIPDGA